MKKILILVAIFIFFNSCNNKESNSSSFFYKKKKTTIYLQPFEDFPIGYLTKIENNLKKIYSDVKINKSISFPDNSWNHNKSRRRADVLINFLSKRADDGELIIGLTTNDISTSKDGKSDWGVFGLGYRPGKSCIASSFRLKNKKEEKLFKVAIHELGHTQGLPHCPVKNCFMRDAEGKDYLDDETEFCPTCKTVLTESGWKLK